MKKNHLQIIALVCIANFMFTACKKETKVEENTLELITTVIVKLTPVAGGGAPLEFKYEDLDGAGGVAATFQEIILAPNKVYNASIIILDKTKSPIDTVSIAIKEEANDHQFYFIPNGGVNITVANLDTDALGRPLGLNSVWTTGAASTGKIFITLKHKPGIKGSNDAITVGETDISTEEAFNGFTVKIQ